MVKIQAKICKTSKQAARQNKQIAKISMMNKLAAKIKKLQIHCNMFENCIIKLYPGGKGP